VTGLPNPGSASDAANKAYVDLVVQDLLPVGSGKINANQTVSSSRGLSVTVGRPGAFTTGFYRVTVSGMTASGGVTVTPRISGSPSPGYDGAGRFAAVNVESGHFDVHIKTGADGSVDNDFYYVIHHL
jgi:hypothetical protein